MEQEHLTKTQERELHRREKEERLSEGSKSERARQWKMTGMVVVILGVFVALIVWQKNQAPVSIAETFSDPTKGDADASVTLREFSDLQCPACRSAQPMVKQIIEEFKDDLKFVYEDFPLSSHKNGLKAAEAGQCAYEEGKFFEFQEKMFAEQDNWASEASPTPKFVEYAGSLGMDTAEFETCVTSGRKKDAVDEDVRQGRALQVAATPSFFVNDELVANLRSIEDLRQAIRGALDKTEQAIPANVEETEETKETDSAASNTNQE